MEQLLNLVRAYPDEVAALRSEPEILFEAVKLASSRDAVEALWLEREWQSEEKAALFYAFSRLLSQLPASQ